MPDHTASLQYQHTLPPIPAPMRAAMERDKTFIFNVGPWEHRVYLGSLGTFIVPGCPAGAEHSDAVTFQGEPGLPSIIPEAVVDTVDGRRVTHKWDFSTEGRMVAKNIIGQTGFSHPSNDLTKAGVFIAAGEIPTEVELEAAREKLFELYDARVREADQKFQVNGGMEIGDDGKSRPGITADHIQAAKALGLNREWANKNVQMVACEGCGQSVSPKAVRCHHQGCGAILNEEKARKLFPHLYAHEVRAEESVKEEQPARRGPGRPRAAEVA